MNLNHATNKQTGDQLTAAEWNSLASDVNDLGAGGGASSSVVTVTDETVSGGDATVGVTIASGVQDVGSPKVIELTKKKNGVNTTVISGNNVNIEPREAHGTGEDKNDNQGNMKGGNISLKPGDDIELCSHHRGSGKDDEVSVKVIDGDDAPVKLQLNAAEMTLTTKGKTGNDATVFDINVNSNKNTKGYLKVRAQAIDLRCESNGGVALQPKGSDGQGHENKIKFEHDGGDGKEFGTFNTEKTSIFTDEYRFNESGKVYAVTRGALETTYKVPGDSTSGIKKIDYPTQADDFKDIIDANKSCTWNDIIVAVNYIKSQNPSLGWTPSQSA